jgi:hypothetical protein
MFAFPNSHDISLCETVPYIYANVIMLICNIIRAWTCFGLGYALDKGVCLSSCGSGQSAGRERSGRVGFFYIFTFSTFPNTPSEQMLATQPFMSFVRYVETFFAMLNRGFSGKNTLTGKNGAEGGPIAGIDPCECESSHT